MQALAASCEELRARTGNPPLYPTCDVCISNAYPRWRMYAAFDQNKSIYLENQARYGIIVKEVIYHFKCSFK
jgi:hypothetical protein